MHLDRGLGYQKARSLVADDALRALFEQCMQQSYHFADKLQAAMALQGMETHAKPSWAGAVYRGWMMVRVAVCARKDRAALCCSVAAERMMGLSYELLCSNKYLQYYFPLLKFTFLKQHFSLTKTREDLESLLIRYRRDTSRGIDGKTFSVVNHLSNEPSAS
ncbi:PA2169 family four-helix-bundle protein [Arachidicoccus terrestris]|nr:PA2169 family four-helix-bundle protein [Arachidicoccus terrestris]